MARPLHRLSARTVEKVTAPGRYSDGGGLYLFVTARGGRSWVFRYARAGKERDMGLGAVRDVSLARAREKAKVFRETLADGLDPADIRTPNAVPTFGEAADAYLAAMEGSWRNEKHRAQWRSTLDAYCSPLRDLKVDRIETADVLGVLKPIWQDKAETAARVRGRIEAILDAATAHGQRKGDNPARWRGHLQKLLPARKTLTRGHHAALPFPEAPAFLADLREREAMAARALEFVILTAARTGEAIGATWREIDLDAALWTVPAARMKAGKEHRVPLSAPALAIMRALQPLASAPTDYVFPAARRGKPLSNMAMAMLIKDRMKRAVTVHGFRSAFRDWAGERTNFPREVAEDALAHVNSDKVEAAYRRGDALEKRRALMEAWAGFLGAEPAGVVVPMARA